MFNPYTKAILAAALAFLGGLAAALDDSRITHSELVTAIGAGVAALAVVWAAHKTIKWIVGGALAGLAAFSIAIEDDAVSWQEWITVALAVVVTLYAVYQTSNTAPHTEKL